MAQHKHYRELVHSSSNYVKPPESVVHIAALPPRWCSCDVGNTVQMETASLVACVVTVRTVNTSPLVSEGSSVISNISAVSEVALATSLLVSASNAWRTYVALRSSRALQQVTLKEVTVWCKILHFSGGFGLSGQPDFENFNTQQN